MGNTIPTTESIISNKRITAHIHGKDYIPLHLQKAGDYTLSVYQSGDNSFMLNVDSIVEVVGNLKEPVQIVTTKGQSCKASFTISSSETVQIKVRARTSVSHLLPWGHCELIVDVNRVLTDAEIARLRQQHRESKQITTTSNNFSLQESTGVAAGVYLGACAGGPVGAIVGGFIGLACTARKHNY